MDVKKLLNNSFGELKISAFFIITTTFLLPTIFWLVKPDVEIKFFKVLFLIMPLIFLVYFLVIVLKKLIMFVYENGSIQSEVIGITEADNSVILILKGNGSYKLDTYVSIFYNEDKNIELSIGLGKIIHVQDRDIFQIQILDIDKSIDEKYKIIESLQEKNKLILSRINIMPFVKVKSIDKFFVEG